MSREKWYSLTIRINALESQNIQAIESIACIVDEVLEGLIAKSTEKTCSTYDYVSHEIKELKS